LPSRFLPRHFPPTGAPFSFALNRQKLRRVRRREGRYLLRTNPSDRDPAERKTIEPAAIDRPRKCQAVHKPQST
jgi:hypothetical protein